MKPLTPAGIRGTWGTLLLPLEEDDSIDFCRLSDEIDVLLTAGLDGIYSNGTAGEFYAQTEDEWDRISLLLAERCEAAGVPFQLGACHPDPLMMLSRARRAAALHPAAIQIILPDWWPPTLDEAIAFLTRVADAIAPVPLVLYSPPHVKRRLTPPDARCLMETVPALAGLKVADGDDEWYGAMAPVCARLSVFVPGHRLASGIRRGAAGAYSNVACLSPAGAARWQTLMRTNPDAALDIEGRLRRFMADHIATFGSRGYSNQALDKLLAAIGDWAPIGTRLRWPYRGIPESEAVRLRPVARRMLPEIVP